MFPTCSNRLLAGRNALSATDLTIVSSGTGDCPLPEQKQYSMRCARATHNPSFCRRTANWLLSRTPGGVMRHRAVVCCPRFVGGDRQADSCTRGGGDRGAFDRPLGVRERQGAPG